MSPPRRGGPTGHARHADSRFHEFPIRLNPRNPCLKILRVYESWIHIHFVTDGQQLPTERVREIERSITSTLREFGILFGIHLERERSERAAQRRQPYM